MRRKREGVVETMEIRDKEGKIVRKEVYLYDPRKGKRVKIEEKR